MHAAIIAGTSAGAVVFVAASFIEMVKAARRHLVPTSLRAKHARAT